MPIAIIFYAQFPMKEAKQKFPSSSILFINQELLFLGAAKD